MSDLTQYKKIIDNYAKELKQQIVSKDFYAEISEQLIELISLKYNYKMQQPNRQVTIDLTGIIPFDTNNHKQFALKLERNATAVALYTSKHYKTDELSEGDRQKLNNYGSKKGVFVISDDSAMILYINQNGGDEYLAKIIDCISRVVESILKSKHIPFENHTSAHKVNIELLNQ